MCLYIWCILSCLHALIWQFFSIYYCRITKIRCDGTGVWFQKCSTTHSNILTGWIVLTLSSPMPYSFLSFFILLFFTPLFLLLLISSHLYCTLLGDIFDSSFLKLLINFLSQISPHTHTHTHTYTRTYRLSEALKAKWVKRVSSFFKCGADSPFGTLGTYCTYTLPFYLHFYPHRLWSLMSYYHSFC